MPTASLHVGDAKETLRQLPESSVQTCVTSPPYWGLRDYGEEGQLGLEETPQEYVQNLVDVFDEVRRVLRGDGTLWLNLGDSYAGSDATQGGDGSASALGESATDSEWTRQQQTMRTEQNGFQKSGDNLKAKDLSLIPYRVASALQADGWWLRSDIIWKKPNPMPESVTDRPTSAHEHIFLLSPSKQYYYDVDAIRETAEKGHAGSRFDTGKTNGHMKDRSQKGERDDNGTRNKRDVWEVTTKPYPEAHFAVYPPELIETCIKAGSSKKGECPQCGAPWKRVVDHTPGEYNYSERGEKVGNGQHASGTQVEAAKRETEGWRPTCGCEAGDVAAQTVLDPFSGAGTTGLVALAKGRNYVGIDLSREYCEMAAERIRSDAPLMNTVQIKDAQPRAA